MVIEEKSKKETWATEWVTQAAYLSSLGYKVTLEKTEGEFVGSSRQKFIFPYSDDLFDAAKTWEEGQAIGNVCEYERSRRQLFDRIKGYKNW